MLPLDSGLDRYKWASPEEACIWKWQAITTIEEAQDTPAIINYSSGYVLRRENKQTSKLTMFRTTGMPKGVQLSHYNVISNSVQIVHKRSLVANNPQARARRHRLDVSGERWMAPLPMYHCIRKFPRSVPI